MANSSGAGRSLGQRVWTRLMDRVGSRVVSGIADTSSDAPNAFHKPKRDVYRQMEEERAKQRQERAAAAQGQGHGHDHDHDHE